MDNSTEIVLNVFTKLKNTEREIKFLIVSDRKKFNLLVFFDNFNNFL